MIDRRFSSHGMGRPVRNALDVAVRALIRRHNQQGFAALIAADHSWPGREQPGFADPEKAVEVRRSSLRGDASDFFDSPDEPARGRRAVIVRIF